LSDFLDSAVSTENRPKYLLRLALRHMINWKILLHGTTADAASDFLSSAANFKSLNNPQANASP
jgi:hypothetical protein